jgi:hypothetical protein
MDIGVWMQPAVLQAKLDARYERNTEEAWNLAQWPTAFSDVQPGDQHRLFVAYGGLWRGYFLLTGDALINRRDSRTPFTLLFDTATWTEIPPSPVKHFRGFTYAVPTTPFPSES